MESYFERLQFSGIFNDPNELCMWLAAVTPVALYLFLHDRNFARRALWLAALGVFAYGIFLTKSRGGFLALLTGLGTLCWDRFGWRKTLLIGTVALPVLLFFYAGRQTSLDMNRQTGQTRIQLWSDWLDRFRGSPLLGEGMSYEELDPAKAAERRAIYGLEHLAHNSYLQAFADLGVVGGCLFLGAFYLALSSVYRFGSQPTLYVEPSMKQLQPYLLGTVAAFSMGLLTLTFCFIVPTYIILGLAAAYGRITPSVPPVATPRFDTQLLGRLALAGVAFLATTYLFVRLFVNWT
jgi:O-antigen ligase